jgi:hypothetical protein
LVLRRQNIKFEIYYSFSDYYNQSDLHIAVTTSTGALVEFDSFGLRKHSNKNQKSSWTQCLLIEQMPEAWWEHWDYTLANVSDYKMPSKMSPASELVFSKM